MNILKKLNIMTPKDKAKQLVEQFMPHADWYVFEMDQVDGKPTCNEWQTQNAKQCALIAVDEIIVTVYGTDANGSQYDYWQQVKAEIEKL